MTATRQYSETLDSLRDHYVGAVQRGDTDRAMRVAESYRRMTDRLISEDIDPRDLEPADWRTPLAEAHNDPEPDRITDPGAWHAWRFRQLNRAAPIV